MMQKAREPYLAVLMDFLMPVMDGITATRKFREWERTVLQGEEGNESLSSTETENNAETNRTSGDFTIMSSNTLAAECLLCDNATADEDKRNTPVGRVVRYKRQGIIGMSANAEDTDVEAAKAAGLDSFLCKPVKLAEVEKAISELT